MTRSWIYSPSGSIKDILVQIYLVLQYKKWCTKMKSPISTSKELWQLLGGPLQCTYVQLNWGSKFFRPSGGKAQADKSKSDGKKMFKCIECNIFQFPPMNSTNVTYHGRQKSLWIVTFIASDRVKLEFSSSPSSSYSKAMSKIEIAFDFIWQTSRVIHSLVSLRDLCQGVIWGDLPDIELMV